VKSLASFVLSLAFAATAAHAQITVEVALEQEYYLAHERCVAEVRITNFSGRPLRFGPGSEWLDLAVESNEGYFVAKLKDLPAGEVLEVPSAARGKWRVDLAPCFELSRPGRYKVTALVRIPGLNVDIHSVPAVFHIMAGVEIWAQNFGIPSKTAGQPFDTRRYALLQTNNRKRLALYLRITDETETRVHSVYPLGNVISFGRPEAQVDREGRLHVLFQTGARQFAYYVIQYDGEVLVRQMHQITDSRPRLRSSQGGQIKVMGGFRLKSPHDIPPPEPEVDLELALPPDAADPLPPVELPTLPPPSASPKDEPGKRP
jgi:hypothetical protein